MRFGPKCERGFLPVFSVGDEAEAERLLVLACPRNAAGDFVARELIEEQTLDNLYAFGEKLRRIHDEQLVPRGRCTCVGVGSGTTNAA